jgi:hypothetical protein
MTALPGPSPRRPRQTGLINYGLARHHLHKRVGTWLQPGGHLEPGESLGTRQRETREDSPCGTPTEARGWSTATPIPPDSTPTEPSISARLSRPRNRRSWLPRWRQRGSERFEAPAFLRGLHVGRGAQAVERSGVLSAQLGLSVYLKRDLRTARPARVVAVPTGCRAY